MNLNIKMTPCRFEVTIRLPRWRRFQPFLSRLAFLSIATSLTSTSKSAPICAAVKPEALVRFHIKEHIYQLVKLDRPDCKIGEDSIRRLLRLEDSLLLIYWQHLIPEVREKEELWRLRFSDSQRLSGMAGRVNQCNSNQEPNAKRQRRE